MSDPGCWASGGTWALGGKRVVLGCSESRGVYYKATHENEEKETVLVSRLHRDRDQNSQQPEFISWTGTFGVGSGKAREWGVFGTPGCWRDLSSRVAQSRRWWSAVMLALHCVSSYLCVLSLHCAASPHALGVSCCPDFLQSCSTMASSPPGCLLCIPLPSAPTSIWVPITETKNQEEFDHASPCFDGGLVSDVTDHCPALAGCPWVRCCLYPVQGGAVTWFITCGSGWGKPPQK